MLVVLIPQKAQFQQILGNTQKAIHGEGANICSFCSCGGECSSCAVCGACGICGVCSCGGECSSCAACTSCKNSVTTQLSRSPVRL